MSLFAFKKIVGHWRVLFYAFFISSFGYLILGWYWNSVISSDIAHKFNYNKLLESYNHNIVWDFFNKDSISFSIVNSYIILFFILSLLFYIFINSGLVWLSNSDQKVNLNEFFGKCRQYFLKNLGLAVLYLFVLVFSLGIYIYFIITQLLAKIEDEPSEKPLVLITIAILALMTLTLFLLITASILSRKLVIENSMGIWNSFRKGIYLALKNYFTHLFSWIIFLVLTIFITWLYIRCEQKVINIFSRILFQFVFLFIIFILKFNLYSRINLNSEFQKK